MNINELTKDIHKNAVEHGWWEEERSFGEIIALCHSELSEALEEYRNCKPIRYYVCDGHICTDDCNTCENDCRHERDDKPEGLEIELADTIIRILDYCGHVGIDIEEAIRIKHEYNKTREFRHGGKKI